MRLIIVQDNRGVGTSARGAMHLRDRVGMLVGGVRN
jgi:hypothetical protein